MKEMKLKQWILFGGVVFVIILLVELGIVRILDYKQEKDPLVLNVGQKMIEDIDKGIEDDDAESYSELLGRELTKDEQQEQMILSKQQGMLRFNNLGLALDFMLPSGEWFLNEDLICVCLRLQTDEETYRNYFVVENDEILKAYREYFDNTFYSHDKTTKEMIERYRYYQLVFESFYVDDNKLIPEKVSIYKVESMLPEGSMDDTIEVTDCVLAETLEFEVSDTNDLKHYELAEKLDRYNVTEIAYNYTCDGLEGYSVLQDCTLNSKGLTLEKRKILLEEGLNETYTSKKRDLIGMSNYYYRVTNKDSERFGGQVAVVVCEQNIFYRVYLYVWRLMLVLVLVNVVVAVLITVVVSQIQKYKKNKKK